MLPPLHEVRKSSTAKYNTIQFYFVSILSRVCCFCADANKHQHIMHESMTYTLLYIICFIIWLQILGAICNGDKVGLLAYPLCYAFPTSGQWLVCNRKKGLTAAGTAQVSHLIPIYPIAFAAAKVQITEQNTKQKWIYFNKNLKNPLSEIDTLIRVF